MLQAKINELEQNMRQTQETNQQLLAKTEADKQAEAQALLEENADVKKLFDAIVEPDPTEKPKIDDLSPKELLNVITNGLEQVLTAQGKQTDQKILQVQKAADEKVDKLTNVMQSLVTHMDVGSVSNKYPDFEQVKPWIEKVNARYPGMNMEDMYKLGKANMAGEMPPAKVTESEMPNDILSYAGISNDRVNQMNPQGVARSLKGDFANQNQAQIQQTENKTTGIVQWRDIIDRGVNKVISARLSGRH